MARLPRPHVPLLVRLQVAERQLGFGPEVREIMRSAFPSARVRLDVSLRILAAKLDTARKLELHHRPALVNRRRKRNGEYDPPANDPAFLFYLPDDDHDIETRVRGVGAQRSDLSQRRYLKRVARNRDPNRPRHRWARRKMRKKRKAT